MVLGIAVVAGAYGRPLVNPTAFLGIHGFPLAETNHDR
jgi:hypothetical protein